MSKSVMCTQAGSQGFEDGDLSQARLWSCHKYYLCEAWRFIILPSKDH